MEKQSKPNRFRDLPLRQKVGFFAIFGTPTLIGLGLGLGQGANDIKDAAVQVQAPEAIVKYQEESLALEGLAGAITGLAAGGALAASIMLREVIIDYRKQPQPTMEQSQENPIA